MFSDADGRSTDITLSGRLLQMVGPAGDYNVEPSTVTRSAFDNDKCHMMWLACWTQVQKGPGSNRSRDAVG